MYCSACGQPMDASQTICQRCGRQSTPIASAAALTHSYFRVHRHVQAVAVLWIAYSLWILLHWAFTVGVLASIFGRWGRMGQGFGDLYSLPFMHVSWLVPLITGVMAGRAVLCAVTGLSLLYRASWARILAIVTAFLALIHPLTGTALAIYTLWVFLPSASAQEYQKVTL